MSKIITGNCKIISIYKLKKWGCLDNVYRGGLITWTNSFNGEENDVIYTLDLSKKYFKLNYQMSDWQSEEWKKIEHKYPILTTPCNYGGRRYWFECSAYKNGIYCGRRVAKLYLCSGSHYFACRHCYNLTYESRNNKYYGINDLELERLESLIKRTHYQGRPTKKYKGFLKKRERSDILFFDGLVTLMNRFTKNQKLS